MRPVGILLALMLSGGVAASDKDRTATDTAAASKHNTSLSRHRLKTPFLDRLYELVKQFSRIDTAYIEPQHYNFAVMLQNTNTYEIYHLRNEKDQEVVFAPRPAYKVGPYFGWRWIFLGYTFDVRHLKKIDGRQDFNLSLYSNQVGVDLFYRKSGNSYRVINMTLDNSTDTSPVNGAEFGGVSSSIKGFNLYYIFNHKRFSYPAAYSQSTIQRRSSGSLIAGIGYTKHKLNVDWQNFDDLVKERLGATYSPELLDTTLMSSSVNYTDYTASGGYAYNWVFAYNWLFDVSLQAGLGYKRSTSDTNINAKGLFRNFDFKNFNMDGILRMGIIWNNTQWFAGASTILHAYNYKKSKFSTNNIFGSVNFYVGYNFGKR